MIRLLVKLLKKISHRESMPTLVPVQVDEHAQAEVLDHPSQSGVVPYDEFLLERSRSQWQFGDWSSLLDLGLDKIRHHPERAKLALLAASAHQQNNDMQQARQFFSMAQQWGCTKSQIAKIALASVHNTLGCAAALNGQEKRAMDHFTSSVKIGMPGSDPQLVSQARARHQLALLGHSIGELPGPEGVPRLGHSTLLVAKAEAVPVQRQSLEQTARLTDAIGKQAEELQALKRSMSDKVTKEVQNLTRQLEAYIGLQSWFGPGQVMPEFHGWPVSPDFAFYLVRLIEKKSYDLIVEFGSGSSTLLISQALAKANVGSGANQHCQQVAFEHLAPYHEKTCSSLAEHGRSDSVQVELAPLKPWKGPDGKDYQYYSCVSALERLIGDRRTNSLRVLVVVDGPPAKTGKHARYPALPILLQVCPQASFDFLLDDYIRPDEKEVVRMWIEHLACAGYRYEMSEMKMEKDACLLAVEPARIAT